MGDARGSATREVVRLEEIRPVGLAAPSGQEIVGVFKPEGPDREVAGCAGLGGESARQSINCAQLNCVADLADVGDNRLGRGLA